MDNARIAFECLHAIENGNRECKEFDALKLDLTKTYDRVQWEYLEEVMKRLGFHRKWVQWIMSCVSSVRYSVYFNNMSLDFFTPSHGLRQGGFFFVADSLSKLIHDHVSKRNIQELHICRRSPGVSHLLFVDDTLLFIKATEDQANRIKDVLGTFEKCTGQLINPMKCSMMFGRNCSMTNKDKVLDILRVPNTTMDEKCLGLPTLEGRMNKEKFKTTKQRLVKRCSSWVEKNMSMAAKEVLIKLVAQAIPT
jgi:hypothetical protein